MFSQRSNPTERYKILIALVFCFLCQRTEAQPACRFQIRPFEKAFVSPQDLSSNNVQPHVRGKTNCTTQETVVVKTGARIMQTMLAYGQAQLDFKLELPEAVYGSHIVDFWESAETHALNEGQSVEQIEPIIYFDVLPAQRQTNSIAARFAARRTFDAVPGNRLACNKIEVNSGLVISSFTGERAKERSAMFMGALGIQQYRIFSAAANCLVGSATSEVKCLIVEGSTTVTQAQVVYVDMHGDFFDSRVFSVIQSLKKRGSVVIKEGTALDTRLDTDDFNGFVTSSWPLWRLGKKTKSQAWALLAGKKTGMRSPPQHSPLLTLLLPLVFPTDGAVGIPLEPLLQMVENMKQSGLFQIFKFYLVVLEMDGAKSPFHRRHTSYIASLIRAAGADVQLVPSPHHIEWHHVDVVVDLILFPFVASSISLQALHEGVPLVSAGVNVEVEMALSSPAAASTHGLICRVTLVEGRDIFECLKQLLLVEGAKPSDEGAFLTQDSRLFPDPPSVQLLNHGWLQGVLCMSKFAIPDQTEDIDVNFDHRFVPLRSLIEEAERYWAQTFGPAMIAPQSTEDANRMMEKLAGFGRGLLPELKRLNNVIISNSSLQTSDSIREALQVAGINRPWDEKLVLWHSAACLNVLRHELMQLRHLEQKHPLLRPLLGEAISAKETELRRTDNPSDNASCAIMEPKYIEAIHGLVNAHWFKHAPAAWKAPALNPTLDFSAIEADYYENAPGFTYFDDFLTQDTATELLNFAMESSMYFDEKNGYVGAYMTTGFVHPALLRLVQDLRAAMPNLMQDYVVDNIWSYKAMHSVPRAIGIHADAADLNLNFWLTESSANMDADSGGLVLYLTTRPPEWSFLEYNAHQWWNSMYQFVEEANATRITIPFRQGRCVVFNSSLFHESDAHHFRPGYKSQRINFTILMSKRSNILARPASAPH